MGSPKTVTKYAYLAAWCKEIQTREVGAGAKGKILFRCHATWKNGGSRLKDYLPFLLKPLVLIRTERGRLIFYPITLLAFGVLRSYTFIFLAFVMLSVRTSPAPSWPMRKNPQCTNSLSMVTVSALPHDSCCWTVVKHLPLFLPTQEAVASSCC